MINLDLMDFSNPQNLPWKHGGFPGRGLIALMAKRNVPFLPSTIPDGAPFFPLRTVQWSTKIIFYRLS